MWSCGNGRRDIYYQGQLVHKFIFPSWSRRSKTAEQIHHATCNGGADPDIAIYDPQYIALGFTVCSAHIPNLGIRSQVTTSPISI